MWPMRIGALAFASAGHTRVIGAISKVSGSSGPLNAVVHRPEDYLADRAAIQLAFGQRPLHGACYQGSPQDHAGSQTILVTLLHCLMLTVSSCCLLPFGVLQMND